jgi:hypothetical protein
MPLKEQRSMISALLESQIICEASLTTTKPLVSNPRLAQTTIIEAVSIPAENAVGSPLLAVLCKLPLMPLD